jgi:myo-inositol-1(or 4)-monophosphatase
MVDPFMLLALAERIALDAARLVSEGRKGGLTDIGTKSTITDMVTEFDRASESLIVGNLRAERPDDAIIGEEGTQQSGNSGVSWLVDPIDGTTNFLYDLPGYAVSIGARDGEGPLLGVVSVPSLAETYTAVRGHGAWCNGTRIQASDQTELSSALVGTGFAYQPENRVQQAEELARLIGHVRDIRRFGAAATDLCFVARGRLDAYFERGLGPWDMAAGEIIAREAGALTSDFSGGPARPGQAVAAAPGIHEQLLALLARADIR